MEEVLTNHLQQMVYQEVQVVVELIVLLVDQVTRHQQPRHKVMMELQLQIHKELVAEVEQQLLVMVEQSQTLEVQEHQI